MSTEYLEELKELRTVSTELRRISKLLELLIEALIDQEEPTKLWEIKKAAREVLA